MDYNGSANRTTARSRAARKAHKKATRQANLISRSESAFNAPLVLPGTRIHQRELLQCRRWLENERATMPHRFSRDAINEVAELFAKDPAVRASNPLHGLSDAAKELVKTLETERDEAAAEGVEGDWWAGVIRKGVSVEAQVEHAREKMSRAGIDWKELLGVDGMGMEEAVGIPKGMQYVDYDDDVKEDGEVNNQGFASMTSIVATMEEGEEEDMEMKDTEELAARHLARAVATNDMT